jgi:putative PEP-CTERM system TPR-repeat lipoprotein
MMAAALGALTSLSLLAAPAEAAIGTSQANQNGSQNPSGLGDLLRQARKAMQEGHANVAVIYLKNAVALAPKNNDVRVELGYAYLRSGDFVSSIRELRTARADGAPDAKVLPILFDAMLAHSEGQALLDQFPAPSDGDRSPLAAVTYRARATALAQTSHLDLAADSIDHALAINRDVPSLVQKARIAKDRNDIATAVKLSDEAFGKAPNDATVLLLRVTLMQMTNKPDVALSAANSMVKLYPSNPLSLLSRASVFLQMQRDAEARADVDSILNQWKGLPQAVYYKSLLLERAKDPNGAWNVAQTLPPEFTKSKPEIAILVAQMAALAGHTDVAINILSSASARFPDDPNSRIQLASMYLRINNAQRALDTLQPMRESQDPRAMILLGQAYAMQKQFGKSTEYFEKASASGFGGDLLKRQIAATNMRNGDFDSAVKELRDINARQPGDQVTAGLLVTGLLRNGDVAGAKVVADKLVASSPKSAYGPLFQGQIMLAKADYNGAIGAFGRSLAIDPKFIPALYDRGVARGSRGDLAGANADFQAIVKADPKNVMAMIRAAEVNIRMNQDKEAEAILRHAVSVDPKNSMSNLALASYFISRNRMNDASAAIGSFLKLVPNDVNGQMVQAEIQLASGQPDPALATFRRLASARPDSPQIQMMLGTTLVAKKDINGAISAYKRALEISPKFNMARSALIRVALATNNKDVALAAAQDGTKVDPGTQSDLVLATTLVALKQYDQAQAVLKQSQAQRPSEAGAILYSQLLRQAKKPKPADAVLSDWIAKHPTDAGARLEFAQQQMASNPAAAEDQFRAVLKIQPNNMIALNNLSWLLQKKDPKQAVSYAERAVKLAPNSAPVLDTLGWVKWQAKDGAGALPILQKAHAADSGNPEIAYHLAVVLDGNGRRAEAKKTLSEVLSSNQTFDERAEAEALNVRWR